MGTLVFKIMGILVITSTCSRCLSSPVGLIYTCRSGQRIDKAAVNMILYFVSDVDRLTNREHHQMA